MAAGDRWAPDAGPATRNRPGYRRARPAGRAVRPPLPWRPRRRMHRTISIGVDTRPTQPQRTAHTSQSMRYRIITNAARSLPIPTTNFFGLSPYNCGAGDVAEPVAGEDIGYAERKPESVMALHSEQVQEAAETRPTRQRAETGPCLEIVALSTGFPLPGRENPADRPPAFGGQQASKACPAMPGAKESDEILS